MKTNLFSIYATIYHSETNCDGYKPEGITFPSIDAQCKLIEKTYQEIKLDPEKWISYVEGHITGIYTFYKMDYSPMFFTSSFI